MSNSSPMETIAAFMRFSNPKFESLTTSNLPGISCLKNSWKQKSHESQCHICIHSCRDIIQHNSPTFRDFLQLPSRRRFNDVIYPEQDESKNNHPNGVWQEKQRYPHANNLVDDNDGRVGGVVSC